MSKNVLILSSSPRRGGNSEMLCNEFAKGAKESGHRAEKIALGDVHIHYCTGCGACYNMQKPCPQKDDMEEVFQKMLDADVIVMASPVYFYSIAAQMKTLIDRCCARYTELKDKDFYFIMTAAESDKFCMDRTLECFRGFTDCLTDSHEKGVVYGTGVWQSGEVSGTSYMQEAYDMGVNL